MLAILGLVVLSVLVIDVFDTSYLFNPTGPKRASPPPAAPSSGPRPNGTLIVMVTSNQNVTDPLAPPTDFVSDASGVPVLVFLPDSAAPAYEWDTNAQGLTGCIQCLAVGPYVLGIQYDGLNMTIPVGVIADNQTLVRVNITGSVYPLIYSRESGVLVTSTAAQYTMFAQVTSSGPVANVSQPVSLTVSEGAPKAAGYSVNATVISLGAPTAGTQWLQLGTPSPVDVQGATSITMTAWTSSITTTTGPVTYTAAQLKSQSSSLPIL